MDKFPVSPKGYQHIENKFLSWQEHVLAGSLRKVLHVDPNSGGISICVIPTQVAGRNPANTTARCVNPASGLKGIFPCGTITAQQTTVAV